MVLVKCLIKSFPGGAGGKEPSEGNKRRGFDPWVRKIPWRRAWQLTPVFLPGESPGTGEPGGFSPQSKSQLRLE